MKTKILRGFVAVCGAVFGLLLFSNVGLARHFSVSLQSVNGSFVAAENGGGGLVNANRARAAEWETFTLIDLNEGELRHGDEIAFKTLNGNFFSAVDGGGGKLLADKNAPLAWETFKILRLNRRSDDLIKDGDPVALTTRNGNYLTALNGGGMEVNAKERNRGDHQVFRISLKGDPVAGKLSGPFTAPQMIIRPIVGIDESANTEGDFNVCNNRYFGRDFPNCYGGHEGTDFLLAGHILAQAAGSIDVYTVAGGKVVAVADGNTDKCFFKIPPSADAPSKDFVFCVNDVRDGKEFLSNAKEANFVAVLQDDGIIAYYFHLKRNSILLKKGNRVECGQLVGKIGSSGVSSAPHLHLTLARVKSDQPFPASEADFKNTALNRTVADYLNPYAPMLWRELIGAIPRKTCQANAPTCGLGQSCPNNLCQIGLVMKDNVCKRIGVFPNKPCDANQLCGPGLECNGGVCKLPLPKKPNIKLP